MQKPVIYHINKVISNTNTVDIVGDVNSTGMVGADTGLKIGPLQVINSSGEWIGPNSGLIGYTGSQGVIGYTGSRGADGYIGADGYTGSQGIIGYTGSQGVIGYTGSQGIIGYTGSQGIIGYTGSKGYTGSQGIIGYTGSQGIIGYTGSQGVIGYTGSQGVIGYTGSQGIIGYTGSQGIIGYTGSQGIIGYTGSQGIIGYTGSQGIIGYTGSQGIIGYTGSQGIIGYTGSQGIQGNTGYVGSQGTIATNATIPPTPLYEGQIWFDTETLKTYVYYDSFWVEVGGSEMGTLYIRNGFTVNTSSLADNESQNLTISSYKSYVLMKISTSHACWIRIYTDEEARTVDETRPISTDPIAGSGVIAEFVTNGNETQRVTPFIFGGNLDVIPTTNMYLRVTNLSGASNIINISILLTKLET